MRYGMAYRVSIGNQKFWLYFLPWISKMRLQPSSPPHLTPTPTPLEIKNDVIPPPLPIGGYQNVQFFFFLFDMRFCFFDMRFCFCDMRFCFKIENCNFLAKHVLSPTLSLPHLDMRFCFFDMRFCFEIENCNFLANNVLYPPPPTHPLPLPPTPWISKLKS